MSTVSRKPAAEINAAVAQYARHIDRVVAHHGGTTEHPLGDSETTAITFDAPEPDAEQTAYDLAQHQHRRSIGDWIEDHANRIVWPIVGAFVVLVWVGAVGIGEGWW